ncbi:hypothetical protein AMECASPLE_018256, partial [Ameca splendens]
HIDSHLYCQVAAAAAAAAPEKKEDSSKKLKADRDSSQTKFDATGHVGGVWQHQRLSQARILSEMTAPQLYAHFQDIKYKTMQLRGKPATAQNSKAKCHDRLFLMS